jgi:hypothetical protein
MKQEELDNMKDYLGRKNRLSQRRFFSLPEMYGISLTSKEGRGLDLYDLQQRYKIGGKDAIHKLKQYEYIEQR